MDTPMTRAKKALAAVAVMAVIAFGSWIFSQSSFDGREKVVETPVTAAGQVAKAAVPPAPLYCGSSRAVQLTGEAIKHWRLVFPIQMENFVSALSFETRWCNENEVDHVRAGVWLKVRALATTEPVSLYFWNPATRQWEPKGNYPPR